MRTRRDFLKVAAVIPLAQNGQVAPKKQYHITLWSGGTAVKEWDTDEIQQSGADPDDGSFSDGPLCFNTPDGGKITISGTYSVEEL